MRILKNTCVVAIKVFAAGLGAAAAMWLFSAFMIVEVEGSQMLPVLEPGQKVIADRTDIENFRAGDLVVYKAPYYRTDGQGQYLIRRVRGVREEMVEVAADAGITQGTTEIIEKDIILGKVIRLWVRENAN